MSRTVKTRSRWTVALVISVFVGAAGVEVGAAGVPDCLKGYVTKLRNVLGKAEAEEFFQVIAGFNANAQRGVRAFLDSADDAEDLYNTIYETFERTFRPGSPENPFPSDGAFFEAVGEMVLEGRPVVLPAGLEDTLKQVADFAEDSEGFKRAQGAIFDVFVAKRATSGSTLVFQKTVAVGSGAPDLLRSRKHDMVKILPDCPEACSGLDGVLNENKNWIAPIAEGAADNPVPRAAHQGFEYGDVRLTSLADEFVRDIVLVREAGFESFYRLNFNRAMAPHAETIKKVLLKQFESPYVTRQISDVRINELKDDLLRKFDDVVTFLP